MYRKTRDISASLLLAFSMSSAVLGVTASLAIPSPVVAAELKSSGQFRGADSAHPASGSVEIVRLKGGGHGIKFGKDFRSRGGPDLRVWLSEAKDPRTGRAVRNARHVDLDGLKSTSGEQIYRIPDNVDLADIQSVVIWCRAFGVFFGAAPLR